MQDNCCNFSRVSTQVCQGLNQVLFFTRPTLLRYWSPHVCRGTHSQATCAQLWEPVLAPGLTLSAAFTAVAP